MCTVIEKYSHNKNSFYILDINRYPSLPDDRQIRNICREYNCEDLNGLLIGPYKDDNGYYLKAFDKKGQIIEPTENSMIIFNSYLYDKSYQKSRHTNHKATQTGMVMLI